MTDWDGVVLDGTSGRVAELRLSDLGLTGQIPPELSSLFNLQVLSLSENQLTGEIPLGLGYLSNLRVLSLSDNQLTGWIPPELGNLTNLQELQLGGNQLSGCVPDGLRDGVPSNDLSSLGLPLCSEHPCVIGSAVDGPDHVLVEDCAKLLSARDSLAGTATLNWSADTPMTDWAGVVLGGTSGRVTELSLGNLDLTGQIPAELGSLPNLKSMDLSANKLDRGDTGGTRHPRQPAVAGTRP